MNKTNRPQWLPWVGCRDKPMQVNVLEQCPKCLSKITNEVECEICGIVFAKYFQVEARGKDISEQISRVTDGSGNQHPVKWVCLFFILVIAVAIFIERQPIFFSDPIKGDLVVDAQEYQYTEKVADGLDNLRVHNDSYQSSAVINTGALDANINLEYEYYTANADSRKSLLKILNESSPIRENGHIYHGHADWHVKWHFNWHKADDGLCRITKVTTDLTCKITLPKLWGYTSKEQKDRFDNFLIALNNHELVHIDISKKAADEIERKILSLPEMSSCESLDAAADNIGYQTMNEYNEKSVQYDAITGHGKTQGAWLAE